MKQLLLHGPAINTSRKKLIEIQQKFSAKGGPTAGWDPVVTFEKGAEVADILAALQTVSMFDEEKLIIAENPSEDFTVDYTLYPNPYTLILWYDHEIKKVPDGVQALFFPEAREISVFPFLDKLGNKNREAFLEMDKLKKAGLPAGRQGFDSQYLITMIFYLLRNLVATPKGAKDFVKTKNAKMRKNFLEEELIDIYKFVLETDFKIKSGLIEPSQAEFLLVNVLTH